MPSWPSDTVTGIDTRGWCTRMPMGMTCTIATAMMARESTPMSMCMNLSCTAMCIGRTSIIGTSTTDDPHRWNAFRACSLAPERSLSVFTPGTDDIMDIALTVPRLAWMRISGTSLAPRRYLHSSGPAPKSK